MQLPDYYPDAVSAGHQSSACFSQPKELQCYHLSILLLMLLGNHLGGSGYTRLEAEPRESGTRARAGDPGPRQTQLKPVLSRPSGGVPPRRDAKRSPAATEQFLGAWTPIFRSSPFSQLLPVPAASQNTAPASAASPRRTRSRE